MRSLPILLLLGLALVAALALHPRSAGDPRGEILRLLNAERSQASSPPIHLSPALTRAAQAHAAEIASRGTLQLRTGSTGEMRERLRRAGYQAHAWTEGLVASSDDVETMLHRFRRQDPGTWSRLLAPESRDLGVGLERLDGQPLYTLLVAEPAADWFARGTAGIRDLGRVRREMLARVNAERRKAGAPPLRPDAALDRAAQRHAEDMLARRYFAHASPDGRTVRERARDAGYDWRAIGENIAQGQLAVDAVMDTWMHSPGHRKNILDPDFRDFGAGLALGRSGGDWTVEWVQTFGAR